MVGEGIILAFSPVDSRRGFAQSVRYASVFLYLLAAYQILNIAAMYGVLKLFTWDAQSSQDPFGMGLEKIGALKASFWSSVGVGLFHGALYAAIARLSGFASTTLIARIDRAQGARQNCWSGTGMGGGDNHCQPTPLTPAHGEEYVA